MRATTHGTGLTIGKADYLLSAFAVSLAVRTATAITSPMSWSTWYLILTYPEKYEGNLPRAMRGLIIMQSPVPVRRLAHNPWRIPL